MSVQIYRIEGLQNPQQRFNSARRLEVEVLVNVQIRVAAPRFQVERKSNNTLANGLGGLGGLWPSVEPGSMLAQVDGISSRCDGRVLSPRGMTPAVGRITLRGGRGRRERRLRQCAGSSKDVKITGPTLVVIGLFIVVIGAARRFVARPEQGERSTALSRGDLIGGKILIVSGIALLAAGLILTVVELLT
jgi:hypothetical protein